MISIVIPAINEAKNITGLLEHLQRNSTANNIAEIIVVDGGSSDDTVAFAKAAQATVLTSEKGRAKQMNTGARHATGDILYFLHADSYPPKDFDRHILKTVNDGNLAGCFRMRFDHRHWWLRLAGWLTQFKHRSCRGGDQSQFITKNLFWELGGFNEKFIIYEDNDLINKLYARQEFTIIPHWLTTSARRYRENGIWKLQYHFLTIYVKKMLGASADDLHEYYKRKIA